MATAGAGAVTVRISASSDTTDGVLSTNPHDDVLGSGIAYDLDSVAAVGTRTIYYQFGDGADTWSAVQTTTVNTPGPITAGRLAGPDRYATAVAISKAAFFGAGSDASAPVPQQPGVPVAVVATGLNFPDALAGGGAAGRLGGPVLLVGSTVPASVSAEIARLRPQRIIVLGGTSVVSTGVFSQLDALAPAGAIRIGGTNRYATAAAASNELFAPESRLGNGTVFVATGLNYPDALAGAPLAGYWKAPVLTVAPTALPAVTSTEIQRLAPTVVIILGGTASVSSSVEGQLRALVPSVTRIAGGDRYATAAAVVARLESDQPPPSSPPG